MKSWGAVRAGALQPSRLSEVWWLGRVRLSAVGKLQSGVQGAGAGDSVTTAPGPCLHCGCADRAQKGLSVCRSQRDLLLAAVLVSLHTMSYQGNQVCNLVEP